MGSRFTKKIPEYVYFWGEGEWVQGPYVKPQSGRTNKKFKLSEVTDNPYPNLTKEELKNKVDEISKNIMKDELVKFFETVNSEFEMGLNSEGIPEYVDNYLTGK